jgi:hypothetical protein
MMPTNKNFGVTFSIIFLLISGYCFYINIFFFHFIFISIFFLIFGLLNSKLLFPLNWLWYKFGLLLSKLFSPIILFFLFFIIISPYGLILRLFNNDIKNLKKKKLKNESYWGKDNNDKINFDKQF